MSDAQAAELLKRITQTPEQCGGKPCVRGMRVRVRDVLEALASGMSPEQVVAALPHLEPDDIRACLLFAARWMDIPRVAA